MPGVGLAKVHRPQPDKGFLSQHNGVRAFLWTPSYGYRQIKMVCWKWSVKAGLVKTTLTVTFEQVVI
nr:phage tail protein [Salmonella enterica]